MDEKAVDRKLTRFFWKSLGLWPIASMDAVICPRCHNKIVPSRGRPDIFILNPTGPTMVCEVKVLRAGDTSFSFSELTEKQREWLGNWAEDGGQGYIGFGVIRQHGARQLLENLYLLPYEEYLRAEALIEPYQGSIPLEAGPGYRTELQEQNLDILHIFRAYELQRDSGSWLLPEKLQEVLSERPNNNQ